MSVEFEMIHVDTMFLFWKWILRLTGSRFMADVRPDGRRTASSSGSPPSMPLISCSSSFSSSLSEMSRRLWPPLTLLFVSDVSPVRLFCVDSPNDIPLRSPLLPGNLNVADTVDRARGDVVTLMEPALEPPDSKERRMGAGETISTWKQGGTKNNGSFQFSAQFHWFSCGIMNLIGLVGLYVRIRWEKLPRLSVKIRPRGSLNFLRLFLAFYFRVCRLCNRVLDRIFLYFLERLFWQGRKQLRTCHLAGNAFFCVELIFWLRRGAYDWFVLSMGEISRRICPLLPWTGER